MHIIPDNAQHIGARERQEDSFGFSSFDNEELVKNRGCLAVIADGMGGMSSGREASNTAVQSFLHYYQDLMNGGDFPTVLRESLLYANQKVCQYAKENDLVNQVGTTLIAAAIKDDHLYWISAGDSRIYLFRDHQLIQLTQDHVYEKILLEEAASGRMSMEEVKNHPQKEALTSFLGLEELKKIDGNVKPFPLEPGDRILLCTDGLFGFLSEEEITNTLMGHIEWASQELVNRVVGKSHPYQDNVTVAILNYRREVSHPTTQVYKEEVKPTVRQHKKTRRYLPILLSMILIIALGGGGYFGYVYLVKTEKYKEGINTVLDFFNPKNKEKEGEK
ncbi:protein phosphatase 2C domain-containing protein [Bacillus sp. 31A1R]|uniref:Protein phosphatase 2C domain-containing protein n=1 Tax=Robertmurraya mangrovi TaxID=3098077 RepID=A0ABU5J0X9_9BACI|nr:protein phosphatase 2C domain-containing protein [Bacillus sp. 31A1R]MDZ5473054.1 protein phosphatase 2C domain-containing protein [Bacillus sp. 31A1R]